MYEHPPQGEILRGLKITVNDSDQVCVPALHPAFLQIVWGQSPKAESASAFTLTSQRPGGSQNE